jgi:hypothetical protein
MPHSIWRSPNLSNWLGPEISQQAAACSIQTFFDRKHSVFLITFMRLIPTKPHAALLFLLLQQVFQLAVLLRAWKASPWLQEASDAAKNCELNIQKMGFMTSERLWQIHRGSGVVLQQSAL